MESDPKSYISKKLLSLLAETGETQASLAEYCNTKQGQVADHVRGRAYPKMILLLKYWQFFKTKLNRSFTLYELTGLDIVREFEDETQASDSTDAFARSVEDAFRSLSEDDPRKKAIQVLLDIYESD